MTLPKLAMLLLAVAPPFALTGCAALDVAAGDTTTERRTIEDVSAVTLAAVGDLHISTGAEPSLTITAGDRVIDRITSEVRDGTLVLDLDPPQASARRAEPAADRRNRTRPVSQQPIGRRPAVP